MVVVRDVIAMVEIHANTLLKQAATERCDWRPARAGTAARVLHPPYLEYRGNADVSKKRVDRPTASRHCLL
jgi:hypothetical protein